jgi:hypothetical protein
MKTHPLNVSYLVVGLVFLGISGLWALRAANVIDLAGIRWLLPLTLVAAGVIGLVAFAAKGLTGRNRDRDEQEPDETGSPDDYTHDYTSSFTSSYDNEGEAR